MRTCFSLLIGLFTTCAALAADEPAATETIRFQITGLFSPDRVDDLKLVMADVPEIELISVDYERAEASFRFDPAQVFPNSSAEQLVERFNNRLRSASYHTFGARASSHAPREKLQWLEIPVVGLDCKGCCLGAYEAIYRIEGVEQATASFKEGRVRALIDPEKTDRAALEAALKQRNVQLKTP